MVNEQTQQILNKLEHFDFLLDKESIAQSLSQGNSSLVINDLLTILQQQTAELVSNRVLINSYQAQIQGLHTKLTRNKPRRLSLNEGETSFVSLSPRRGSSRSDYEEHLFPFSSLRSPRSLSPTTIPELDSLSGLVQQRETELTDNAQDVINELQNREEGLNQQVGLLRHQLAQHEDYIKHLLATQAEQEKIS
ncbi:MAG: hypothetical protein NY202_03080 [Mollicutes bacterium UO1]